MMRRILPVLVAALAVSAAPLLTTSASAGTAHGGAPSTPSASSAPAAHRPPGQDYVTMPRHCATRKQEIPQKPVECKLTPFRPARPTVVLWGDSHAWMMIPALEAAVRNRKVNLVAFVMGSCPPMDPRLPRHTGNSCDQNNELAIAFAKKLQSRGSALRVVLGGSWERYYAALRTHDRSDYTGTQAVVMRKETPRLFHTLARAHVPTVVDGQVPTVPDHHRSCSAGNLPYACTLPRDKSLPYPHATTHFIEKMMKPLPGRPSLIDVSPAICNTKKCYGEFDGIHTWFDDLHLSATKSRTLKPFFTPVVDDLLGVDDGAGSSTGTTTGSGSGSGSGGGSGGCGVPIICSSSLRTRP